jgi:sigma-B regulation protein RsbQ
MASTLKRNNIKISGSGERFIVFAHGFGCDQNMWRFVSPAFENEFRTVLFDHVGAGGSDLSAYDTTRYATLSGYADDLVEIGNELSLTDAVFVGHSVSAMIGVMASIKAPEMFERLILVGPSARYVDEGEYIGGFSHAQLKNCSNPLLTITWDGPQPWLPPSWAIRIGRSSGRNSQTASAGPIPTLPRNLPA